MPIAGTFTLKGTYEQLGGAPAAGNIQIDGIPNVIVDATGDKVKVGPKKPTLDTAGSFTITLPTDVTTGTSTTLGYRVTARLKHNNLDPIEFYAPAAGVTLDMADVTPQSVEPFSVTAANAAAAASAATAAASSASAAAASAASVDAASLAHVWRPSTAYTAGQVVVNPFGDVVTAKTSFTSGTTYDATKWNVSSTYVVKPGSWATVPNPLYIAHRGGMTAFPEETRAAFRGAAAAGAHVLDMDVQKLADGVPVVMHDTTVDRTTNSTGNVSDFGVQEWQMLNATAKAPWGGVSEPPPFWSDVINEFGGKVRIIAEPKDTSTLAAMTTYTDAAGLRDAVVFAASDVTTLTAIKAAGYRAVFFWSGTSIASPTVSAVLAANPDYLGCSFNNPDSDVTTLVATGKPVWVFNSARRSVAAKYIALGASGFWADDAQYVSTSTALKTRDSWRSGVWGHGLNTNRTTMPNVVNGTLQLPATAGSVEAITVGEVSPVANAAGTYTVDIDAGFSTLPTDTTRAVDLTVGIADDSSSATVIASGWNAFMRANGSFAMFKNGVQVGTAVTTPALQNPTLTSTLSAGVAVTSLPVSALTVAVTAGMQFWLPTTGQIAVASGSAAVAATAIPVSSITPTATVPSGAVLGQMAHLRIAVTPTTVTATRTDTGSTPLTTTDSALRGGYVAIRRFSTADGVGIFKNLVVS